MRSNGFSARPQHVSLDSGLDGLAAARRALEASLSGMLPPKESHRFSLLETLFSTVHGDEVTTVSTVDIYILDKLMTIGTFYVGHHCH